jgi:hypothetical protein
MKYRKKYKVNRIIEYPDTLPLAEIRGPSIYPTDKVPTLYIFGTTGMNRGFGGMNGYMPPDAE